MAPSRSSAKKFSEDIAEDIFKAGREIEPSPERPPVSKGRVAKLIVLGPLFGIREDLIGLRDFLKFFFCLFVSGISVRMVLQRQLPVGLFDLFFTGTPVHPK